MKYSFRLTLLTILLLLVGTTALTVGGVWLLQARGNAVDLASQTMGQTATRIDVEIDKLLRQAAQLSTVIKQRIQAGRLQPDDFPSAISYLQDTMAITDDVSGCFIGLEATGETTGLTRVSDQLSVWQSKWNQPKGIYDVHMFWLANYPRHPYAFSTGPDIRKRPWYVQARQAGRPVWTKVFVFLGVMGLEQVHGLTYATPVYGADGSLLAVLDADFSLQWLCHFLQTLDLGPGGIAFVTERQADGARQVIAHPRPDLLLRTKQHGGSMERELIPPEEFPDRRVSAFATKWMSQEGVSGNPAEAIVRFEADGQRYLGINRQLDEQGAPPWVIWVVLPEQQVLGRVERGIRVTTAVGLGVLALAVLISLAVAAQVARPLERLAEDAKAVGQLRFAAHPVAHSIIREVDHLAVAMEDMKGGLRSFQKFIPADVARAFVSSRQEASFGGERRRVTILFSDIEGFTSLSEELSPEELVDRLHEYLNVVSQGIVVGGGTVDKYIGDAVMAFWGAPAANPQHAAMGCTAALSCQAALRGLASQWQAAGKAPFHTRIGVHTGDVVVGNIGSDARLNYTIIGDAVNLASRLEGLNKYYGTRILISEPTFEEARSVIVARPVDYVSVKGKRIPVVIYEPLDLRAAGNTGAEALAELFGQALQHYRQQDWSAAIKLLAEVVRVRPDDPPAHLLLSRCRAYQATPPAPDWDGVYHQAAK
jgi:adenylate cyclase